MSGRTKRPRGNREQKGKGQNARYTKRTKKPTLSAAASDGDQPIIKPKSVLASLSSDEKCNLVAELSELVLENPTKAFQMEKEMTTGDSKDEGDERADVRTISKVQKLLDLSRVHKNGDDEYIASLSLKDI